jgi:hypothetical protein
MILFVWQLWTKLHFSDIIKGLSQIYLIELITMKKISKKLISAIILSLSIGFSVNADTGVNIIPNGPPQVIQGYSANKFAPQNEGGGAAPVQTGYTTYSQTASVANSYPAYPELPRTGGGGRTTFGTNFNGGFATYIIGGAVLLVAILFFSFRRKKSAEFSMEL